MEVNVNIDVNDLIALVDHLYQKYPAVRRQFRRLCFGFPIIVIGLGSLVFLATEDITFFFSMLGLGIFWLLFMPPLFKSAARQNIRRLYKTGQNRGVFGEQKIVINKTEIARYNQYGHAAYYWPAVERIESSNKYLFIFVSSLDAIVIPKRDFSSEHEFDLFVENARMYHREAG